MAIMPFKVTNFVTDHKLKCDFLLMKIVTYILSDPVNYITLH